MGDRPFFVLSGLERRMGPTRSFLLDEQRRPRFVAGWPPDYFSSQGQALGQSVYNWDTLRQSGYRGGLVDWWIARLRSCCPR